MSRAARAVSATRIRSNACVSTVETFRRSGVLSFFSFNAKHSEHPHISDNPAEISFARLKAQTRLTKDVHLRGMKQSSDDVIEVQGKKEVARRGIFCCRIGFTLFQSYQILKLCETVLDVSPSAISRGPQTSSRADAKSTKQAAPQVLRECERYTKPFAMFRLRGR